MQNFVDSNIPMFASIRKEMQMLKRKHTLNKEADCIIDTAIPPANRVANEEIQRILEKDFASERLLKMDEAAALLGVTTQTLRNWDKSGKLKAVRTDGGHRRFKEADINAIRKEQMHSTEILFHGTTPIELEGIFNSLLKNFDPLEKINLTVRYDTVYNKVRIIVESADGLVGNSRSFYLHGSQK